MTSADWRLALALARRELRGAGSSLLFFWASLTLGVAAIAAVGLVNGSVTSSIARDARVLLGGDIEIENPSQPLEPSAFNLIRPQSSEVSLVVRVSSTAEAAGRRAPVAIQAVDGAYPLLGSVALSPDMPLQQAIADDGAVAETAFAARLGLEPGQRFTIGAKTFTLRAIIQHQPDGLGGLINIGPRVVLTTIGLTQTGIVQPGAMISYDYRLVVAPGQSITQISADLKKRYPDASWRLRTSLDVQPGLARFTDQFATYLTLAGLTILLVGGIGIGLTVQSYLALRMRHIAILHCLGGSSAQIGLAYAMQVFFLGTAGTLGGLLVGLVVPAALLFMLQDALPIGFSYSLSLPPLLIAGSAGLLTTALFGFAPVAGALQATPASLFRDGADAAGSAPTVAARTGICISAMMLGLLIIFSVPRPLMASLFIVAIIVTTLLLTILARLLVSLLSNASGWGPISFRIAVRTLTRKGSHTVGITIALGAGLAVLTAILLTERALEAAIDNAVPKRAPSSVYIDIQPDQLARFTAIIEATPGASIIQAAPQLRARIVRFNGRTAEEAGIAENVRWTLQRDRGVTYSSTQPPDADLVEGTWWPPDYDGPPLVSMGVEYARGFGLKLGDTIGLNILGRVVEAKIVNLRKDIDFTSGRLEFLFIMSPGFISAAPHTIVATVDAPKDTEPKLMAAVAEALPNVTPISVAAMVRQAKDVLDKLAAGVIVIAGVTIASSLVVLAAAIGSTHRRQRYQAVLLKILGARRIEIISVMAFEYFVLGVVTMISGVLLGTMGSLILVTIVLRVTWSFDVGAIATVCALALILVMAVGLASTARLLQQSAADALRTL
ncbi:putative ABC transport system permease protein [Arboricoccus pini]|uniref:Putative ABC transport system permease protein n=1 Tax=Arboricoccus pini TaxID=1963835 RepID=A0A212QT80_9PROT|nr:FtsX-like permease family protein [Arboricoccus pini]SNB62849.1 putative ABC transport system permease protein [Arboricoccus pini]